MSKRVLVETTDLELSLPSATINGRSLKGMFFGLSKTNEKVFATKKILSDINLRILSGESLCIVGRNGSGKSSLLRTLSGIYSPSAGSVRNISRLFPLIELDGAFNGELTVSENIALLLILLEIPREKHRQITNSVLDFSELGIVASQPMRTLSTGMKARFGFAFATSISAELLLIDESISVGDGSFATKAMTRIIDLKRQGVTIVLVTHDLELAISLSEKCLWLENGKTVLYGGTKRVIKRYRNSL